MSEQQQGQAILTFHSCDRLFSRMGGGKKGNQKLANRALQEGICHKETTGSLKRYLDKLYLSYKTANNMRIYGNNIYIFCDQILITVLTLPAKYSKIVKDIKERRKGVDK
jgi:hypothetical protein